MLIRGLAEAEEGTWVRLCLLKSAAHMQEHLQPGPVPRQVAFHCKGTLRNCP